jgi:hypothetical protein
MTLYQFNELDETEQIEAVWEYGVYLAGRQNREHKLILYQIDAFYAEIWYHAEDNDIRKLRAFSSTSQLEPYLKNMDITLY